MNNIKCSNTFSIRHFISKSKWVFLLLCMFILSSTLLNSIQAQEIADQTESSVSESSSGSDSNTPNDVEATKKSSSIKDKYGWWVLLPALTAIVLAIATRQVVPSIVIAIFVGSFMIAGNLAGSENFGVTESTGFFSKIIPAFRLTVEKYILGAINDMSHIQIMVFTLTIGFMVGVIGKNGGTKGIVNLVANKTGSRKHATFTAWLAGLFVFFDDYANTMIVGPTMQPVFDKVKLSREKLAYIVDSTAAPVASIALIGTWVGAEVGFINDGLGPILKSDNTPAFLKNANAMQLFISSIPYRFYAILALFFVLLNALMNRDFGPMLKAEKRQLAMNPDYDSPEKEQTKSKDNEITGQWMLGLLPVLILVFVTVGVLVYTGYGSENIQSIINAKPDPEKINWAKLNAFDKIRMIIEYSESYIAILYGAVVSAISAAVLTLFSKNISFRKSFEVGLDGMAHMFPAVVILILAWSLSAVSKDLQVGEQVASKLSSANFSPNWLPLAVFVSAAGISFTTGTSWGTMGILCPLVVTVCVGLLGDVPESEHASALSLLHASIGSVLAGAIFGDHCSPISDTTVLSSIASGCSLERHVLTQLPYALVCAVVAMLLGDITTNVVGLPWFIGLSVGAIVLILIMLIFGRTPKAEN